MKRLTLDAINLYTVSANNQGGFYGSSSNTRQHSTFKEIIQKAFPYRNQLHRDYSDTNVELVRSTFEEVRGKYSLWKDARENAKWIRVKVEALTKVWTQENIEILYPPEDAQNMKFVGEHFDGIVLWKNPQNQKYQLLEGNHRVSYWLNTDEVHRLPCTLFIGTQKG